MADPLMLVSSLVAAAFGLELEGFVFAPDAASRGSWRDAAEAPDAHRVAFELDVSRPGAERSTLRLFLPVSVAPTPASASPAEEVPDHLAPVEVEISCRLAQTEITLAQLLELEEGDVIPTDVRVDETAQLLLEDETFAEAFLGTHRGRFAVRIAPTSGSPEEPR